MSGLRVVPPAGAPVPLGAVVRSMVAPVSACPPAAECLRNRLGSRNVYFLSSGRAALSILLRAFRNLSNRREVVIPAYTCFSVASAIARAGLVIRLCDIDPKTFDLDLTALSRLDLRAALCVISSGLFGIPGDLSELERIARRAGAFVVDDAAQCLGATYRGRPCGTFGDAGFYSFGRGKALTTMGGGVLVTNWDNLAAMIDREMTALGWPPARSIAATVAGTVIYAAMLPSSRYWIVDRLPFLGLGLSRFDPDFPITRLSAYQKRLLACLLARLDAYTQVRRHHAARLRSGLEGIEGLEIPRPVEDAEPVYLRFPLLARDEVHRARLLAQLRRAGIGASCSYPTAIDDIPGIAAYLAPNPQPCPAAHSIATRLLTLPTHPSVTAQDVATMVTTVRESR